MKNEDTSIYESSRKVLLNMIQMKEEEINEAISIQRQIKEELIKLDLYQFEINKSKKNE